MASSKQAHACYAKKIAGYALQRDIVESDLAMLDAMTAVSMAGGSIKQVMLALVADPAFRTRHGGDAMKSTSPARKPFAINRRAFLRGAAGVAIALPFLEGLPERSAWAQDKKPTFSLFICAANGVVGSRFFPSAVGLYQRELAHRGRRPRDQQARAACAEPVVRQGASTIR